MTPTAPPRSQRWLKRPLGPILTFALALLVVVASAWLFADSLGRYPLLSRRIVSVVQSFWWVPDPVANFRLKGDDFHFLAESRDLYALRANLWTPHNAHVVPLFRLGTFGLIWWSGGLGHIRETLGHASFGVLALLMMTCGHFITHETGSRTTGLAAMAFLGVTSVMAPAATWYSASQTLWAGQLILVMLILLQAWRSKPVWWRIALATLAAFLAPATWGGGLAAGPVGAAYLWADGRSSARRASVFPLAATILSLLLLGALSRIYGRVPTELPPLGPMSAVRGIAHTFQAISEALILNNLGLDGPTTPLQALAFVLALGAVWAWSRGGFRPNPLESAGATLIGTCYFLAYTFRSGFSYSSLRELGWYHAIPQLGAILFGIGWWTGCRNRGAKASALPAARSIVLLLALVGLLLTLHVPRAQRLFLPSVYPLTESEWIRFPIPALHRLRALYLASDLAARQDRFLARLDRVQRAATRIGARRETIRAVFGRLVAPGWPDHVHDIDALDLIPLSSDASGNSAPPSQSDAAQTYAALKSLYHTEPEIRPYWIPRSEPWPPQH